MDECNISEMKTLLTYKEGAKDNSNVPTVTLSDAECTPYVTIESKEQTHLYENDGTKKESEFR